MKKIELNERAKQGVLSRLAQVQQAQNTLNNFIDGIAEMIELPQGSKFNLKTLCFDIPEKGDETFVESGLITEEK